MGWMHEHGEGAAAAVVGEELGVGSAGDGRGGEVVLLEDGGRVPASAISGWRGRCSCGWTGSLWRRAKRPETVRSDARWIYSAGIDPEDAELEGLYREWLDHAETVDSRSATLSALTAAARSYESARAALDDAAAQARTAGASWDAIAQAVGITRQSAHQRWHNR